MSSNNNVNALDNQPLLYVQGSNGQVLTCNGYNTVWITPVIPSNIIWSGTITSGSGGAGGIGQVITSAPQIQLDLPGTSEPPPEKKADGATCKRCEEFNEFAQANQDDDTFLCYRCRHNL